MKRSQLKRKTPLKKVSKKAKRIKAEMDALMPELMKRSKGRCERPGGCQKPLGFFIPDRAELERHHIDKNRNHNTLANVLYLCPYDHDTWGHGLVLE